MIDTQPKGEQIMDPMSGRIYKIEDTPVAARDAMKRGHVIVPPDKVSGLKKASIPARKGWARNKPCPCGSGAKFKKCCWDQFA